MKNENRKIGTAFEQRLCVSLSAYGFWAHNLAQNKQGQPFDVMASRNGRTHPIDAKVCEKDAFKLSRMEENQISAMTLWRETGNGEGWFALEMSNGAVYFIRFSVLMELDALGVSSLNEKQIRRYGITLGEWVMQCE